MERALDFAAARVASWEEKWGGLWAAETAWELSGAEKVVASARAAVAEADAAAHANAGASLVIFVDERPAARFVSRQREHCAMERC